MLELTLDVVVSLFVLVIYFAQEREVSRQASEVPSDYLNDVLPCVKCGAEESSEWGLCDACEVETSFPTSYSYNVPSSPCHKPLNEHEEGERCVVCGVLSGIVSDRWCGVCEQKYEDYRQELPIQAETVKEV